MTEPIFFSYRKRFNSCNLEMRHGCNPLRHSNFGFAILDFGFLRRGFYQIKIRFIFEKFRLMRKGARAVELAALEML